MTSAIVSSTIDADYPVSGQDNDSQGFRDNFSVIKDGLATANAEITVLQNTSAKLNVDNDFGGNVIDNATTNRLYGSVYSTTSTATTNVSLENGEYQRITVVGNHTVAFTDWPETDRFAKIRLELKSSGTTQTITFSTEGGGIVRKEITQSLAAASGVSRKQATGSATNATFSFPTANVTTGSFQVDDRLFGTGLSGEVTLSAINNLTTTATATTASTTLAYTAINGSGAVTTGSSAAAVVTGTKVTFSDNTGIKGIDTGATYYTYDSSGTGFKIATSLSNALAGTAITGLAGTVAYTGIDVGAGAYVKITGTFTSSIPVGNAVTIDNVTGISGLLTGTTYYAYGYTSTGFYLAATYSHATAVTPTPITGASGSTDGVFTGVATHSGAFTGSATATFAELDPNSNRVTVGSTVGMYEGMPIAFTGTTFGGVAPTTDYYVAKIIDSTGLRLATSIGGAPISLSPATGTLTMVPRTVITTSITAQTVASASGLNLTTADSTFPNPFQVSSDVNKIRIVDAWTVDGGTNIFLKYIGEFA
jgi:hypothetical protein